MKKLLGEFRDFIMRGNVLDLAVAVIIGAAFQGIINSMVNDIISPIIGIFGNVDFKEFVLNVNGVQIKYGSFITAVINFLIMALVIFFIIKGVNKLAQLSRRLIKKEEEEEAPATKTCTYCFTEINIKATRCPHCTSVIEQCDNREQTAVK